MWAYRLKVQRRKKEIDSRYIQEASAPAAGAVYQICNISSAHVFLQHRVMTIVRVIIGDRVILADIH